MISPLNGFCLLVLLLSIPIADAKFAKTAVVEIDTNGDSVSKAWSGFDEKRAESLLGKVHLADKYLVEVKYKGFTLYMDCKKKVASMFSYLAVQSKSYILLIVYHSLHYMSYVVTMYMHS
jgi:hypothetical protein